MADFYSKRTGEQIEALLDIVSQGGGGGGEGGTITEAEITAMGFTKNLGTITEVKMNGVSKGTDGVVDLGNVITEHQDISGKQDKIEDLDAIRAGAAAGATALQSEQYKGTVTGVTFYGKDYSPDSDGKVYMGYPDVGAVKEITVNGSTKTPTNGAVDLGTVLTQHQDISQKADLSNGKILASQLPDYILGQVMYGGVINSGDANNIVVQPSVNYKTKYSLEGSTVTVNKYQFWSQQGVYFISGANGTFFDIEVKVGDWLISTGTSVAKVDNTDAVSSVAGLTGVIDASALGKELSYNDLKDKPTIPTAVNESTVSGWGFTKNTGTYSKPSGGIPKTDLASAVQTSLGKADTALQSYTEQYKGTITGVAINGTAIATSGVAYIPSASTESHGTTKLNSSTNSTSTSEAATPSAVKAAYDLANGKQDKLTSGTNIKTINGQSLLGSGNITIDGGSGGVSQEAFDSLVNTVDNIDADVAQLTKDVQEKQDKLVSGTNIKTINGQSLLGSGNITISGGGAVPTKLSQLENDTNFVALQGEELPYIETSGLYDPISGFLYSLPRDEWIGDEDKKLAGVVNIGGFNLVECQGITGSSGDIIVLPREADGYEDDILVTRSYLKTINGQSLVGSGDITISGGGGSSSGSGAYAEANHGTSDTTFTLTPNTFHVWDEVASLTLTFGDEIAGVANEFVFQFTSGSEPTTLTMSDDIKWTEELVIEANRIYQISILKGLASVLSWVVEASIVFPITLEMGDNGDIGISLYSYLQSTYGEPTSGTTLNEEIINNYNGMTFETIEYATYVGFTGYWLNGYRPFAMSWVLLEDGYLQRVLPSQDN